MKKLFFLFVALTATLCVNAERCSVLKVGKYWDNRYKLVSFTDSTLTVIEGKDSVTITYPAESLVEFYLPERKLHYYSSSGKFVTQIQMETERIQTYEAKRKQSDMMRANNPNYAVGQAMRSVAKGSLIIGVPSLIVGTILVGYGQGSANAVAKGKYKATTKELQTYGNCATAGYVLMPFGGALTIVGIPLSIEGKELMRLNINYTGNGAGLALAW